MKNIQGFKDNIGKVMNANMVSMLAMVILVGMGEKMAERFLPLYILAIGGGTFAVGFLNAMDNLLSALYSFPGGYIAEKYGYKKSLMIFTIVAMVGYIPVILIPSWQVVLIGAVFFIAWTAVSLPAVMNLVNDSIPKDRRTMGVSIHSLVRRVPMALGPLAGGLIIGIYGRIIGVRIAFGVAFLLGIMALYLQWRFMSDDIVEKEVEFVSLKNFREYFSPKLINLLASDILIRFAEQIPYAFVVIWVVENNNLSELQFGLLTTVEMVTAMLVYIPVAYFADRSHKKPFVLATFCFFTIFPLFLLFSHNMFMFLIAFVIRGLKEFGEPTRKALIMDLARDDAKARTFGTYYLFRDVIVSIAALSSAFLWNISPATNFIVASAFGVLGTVLFAVYGKDE